MPLQSARLERLDASRGEANNRETDRVYVEPENDRPECCFSLKKKICESIIRFRYGVLMLVNLGRGPTVPIRADYDL